MDRMRFVPGKEAREQLLDAKGHLVFGRETALGFADEFVMQAPANAQGKKLSLLYQVMSACISTDDTVDIWFGLRNVNHAQGEEDFASGELVGHSWATLTAADGRKRDLWEVGRATPPLRDAHAARAFNAYRRALAEYLGEQPPSALPGNMPAEEEEDPKEFRNKPIISRALAPSNLYESSARVWFFVELGLEPDQNESAVLSRPMRAYDALVLATLVTLAKGSPPLVFGISNALDGLGKMPTGFTRANYEADDRLEPTADKPLLVM